MRGRGTPVALVHRQLDTVGDASERCSARRVANKLLRGGKPRQQVHHASVAVCRQVATPQGVNPQGAWHTVKGNESTHTHTHMRENEPLGHVQQPNTRRRGTPEQVVLLVVAVQQEAERQAQVGHALLQPSDVARDGGILEGGQAPENVGAGLGGSGYCIVRDAVLPMPCTPLPRES